MLGITRSVGAVWVVENGQVHSQLDQLTTEEPLEIRLVCPQKTIAVTMRSQSSRF
jgi:FdhD protein